MFGPSQPSGPAVTTSNARGNTRPGVDPGLVTSRASPSRVDPAQWTQVVPSKLASPPAQLARLQWPRFSPGVGDTMLTGQMEDRPQVTWSGGRPGELYTIMILDEGISFLNGKQYAHWLVTNVPGSGNTLEGTEMMRYVEPFSASATDPKHPMLVLVYRQQARLQAEEYQRGCSPSIVSDRIVDKNDLASKYNLELVAGTFFLATYSGKATDKLLCYFTKCNREPFPASIPGVTDLPSCQPSTEVFDITLRGPKLDKLTEYGQALQNLGVAIRGSSSDGISTGLLTESQAYFGVFQDKRAGDVIPQGGNLNTTLQGQINPAFLTYQSRDGASRLFSALGDPTPIFETFAGDAPLSITFSEPDDQEFDLNTFLQTPGEVAFVNIAQVNDLDNYLRLREKLFAKLANSPYVKDFWKFNVWREEPGLFDNSKTEVLIYTSKSREDQNKFVQGLIGSEPEFVNEWWDTFVCRACMSVDRQLGPELQFAL